MIFIQVVVTSGRRAIRPSRPWKRCCFGVTGAFRGVVKNIRLNSWVSLWKWGRIDLNIFYLNLRLGLLPLKIRCEHSNRGFNMIQTCTKRKLDFTGKRRFPEMADPCRFGYLEDELKTEHELVQDPKSLQFLWWSYPNFWWFNGHFRWLNPCFLILTFFFWVDDMLMDDAWLGCCVLLNSPYTFSGGVSLPLWIWA